MERDETLRIFLDQAGEHRLLDRASETTLAQTIDRGRSALRALADTTDASERARLERVIEDGRRARDRFVEANLRLVVSVARTFQGRGLPLPDLVQEGNAGLLRAVDGFDWRRGFKFSTYAVWWIRQAIQRALSEQGHSLRLSSTGADDLARVKRTMELFEEEHRRRPTIDEVVASTGLPEHRVARILDATAPLVSLDAPATSSDEPAHESFGAFLPDAAPSVADRAESATFRTVLDRMMRVLDSRERRIVIMRFGLDGREPATSGEIAAHLKLSTERVRQIEARALSKLRHPSVEPTARELLAG